MLGSMLAMVALALLAGAVAVACTAVPFVKAVDLAEQRGFSTVRWGAVELVLLALAAVVGYVGWRHSLVLLLPAVLLCWAAPLVITLLSRDDRGIGGYQGRHEH
jgi:hypothetical protein